MSKKPFQISWELIATTTSGSWGTQGRCGQPTWHPLPTPWIAFISALYHLYISISPSQFIGPWRARTKISPLSVPHNAQHMCLVDGIWIEFSRKKFYLRIFFIWEILNVGSTEGSMDMLLGLEWGGHSQAPRNVGMGTEQYNLISWRCLAIGCLPLFE